MSLVPPGEFHPQAHSDKMRATSVAAYQQIRDNGLLSRMRWLVYDRLFHGGPMTSGEIDRDISTQLDTWTRSSSPRLNELVRLGVIEERGKRCCTATGMTVLEYAVTGRLPRKDVDLRAPRSGPKRPAVQLVDEALDEIWLLKCAAGRPSHAALEQVLLWLEHMVPFDDVQEVVK